MKKIIFAVMKIKIALFALLLSIGYSCSTDFDVIAPYKEVMIVDGLLNPVDSVQYVKVSKAFLGEGNALVMAQQKDSFNYGDILDVKLQRIQQGQVIETITMIRDESIVKDSGTFNTAQVYYKTSNKIFQDSEYKIIVKNNVSGIEATSQTKIVNDVHVNSPTINADTTIDLASANSAPTIVRFSPGANSTIYDMVLRFNYREIDANGNSEAKKIDWNFTDQFSTNMNEEIKFKFYKYDLFRVIGDNLVDRPGYTRRIDSLSTGLKPFQFIIVAGTEDLQTYYNLQQPASGIVQERPIFTTVQNGLGIFTSRVVHSEFRYPNAATKAAFDTSAYLQNRFQF